MHQAANLLDPNAGPARYTKIVASSDITLECTQWIAPMQVISDILMILVNSYPYSRAYGGVVW